MDFADTINDLCGHMAGYTWVIKGLVTHPNLAGFTQQATELPRLPVEFVKQVGDGDYGYHGDIYFPLPYGNGDGGMQYLHVQYTE